MVFLKYWATKNRRTKTVSSAMTRTGFLYSWLAQRQHALVISDQFPCAMSEDL